MLNDDIVNIVNDFVVGPKIYWKNKFNQVVHIIQNYGPTLVWWLKLFNDERIVGFWNKSITSLHP